VSTSRVELSLAPLFHASTQQLSVKPAQKLRHQSQSQTEFSTIGTSKIKQQSSLVPLPQLLKPHAPISSLD
jgi:hypothetical protein